jgi:transcription-repair coupling factor (superfamily II helicase)
VGYGKTEVALRAAFKAVMDNKQVAVLVPTTILAEQHYYTFTQRLKEYPVNVQMLSRFKSKPEQARIVQDLNAGRVDLIIGTHRLLQPDIKFKDLGLVIIDEEQRFGVKDKEKLKALRMLVDVLTLTATPIPRTLYFSLVGAKDISMINTPPAGRIPVETKVLTYDEEIIQKALNFELERRGQAYYVHNQVKDIEHIFAKLRRLAPKARVGLAHGQMSSKELEEVMLKFIKAEIDILVSTNIIESGIDIPNANTLIVERADLFGLADLYQLSGRVGRFTRKAHAYFLYPRKFVLPDDAQRRLAAIEKHQDLGSGFKIAMEDLQIRGSGNILGKQQHGFISAVGFDLYCRLLKEAISDFLKEKKQNPKKG